MMPPKISGIDFLASSHFKIAQDSSPHSTSLKSVFKNDYTPWPSSSRPVESSPPKPAQVLHIDERFCNEKESESTQAYQFRATKMVRPDMTGVSAKLRATNFKMDRDISKFNSFNTSHMMDYYAKAFQGIPRKMPKQNPMESFIPQGDIAKVLRHASDYKSRFNGHDARLTKPEKAPSMHQVGPQTILGDKMLTHFDTTHCEQFKGLSYPRLHSFPAPTGSNIPQGDKNKEVTMKTVHQSAFEGHDTSHSKPYSKDEVMSNLGQTNFNTHDGHGTFDTYISTAKDCYQPIKSLPAKRAPTTHRNHSDFPEGDLDPCRVSKRIGVTTSGFYHPKHSDLGQAYIVSGAGKRTYSNVWFGDPGQGKNFYHTTTSNTFKPVSAPHWLPSPDMTTKSSVPLHYYAQPDQAATTCTDFQSPHQGKTIPDPLALENLRNSHIHAPLGGIRQFHTEHLQQYTPKTSERMAIDAGRLQRSTIPLGTLRTS